MPDRPVEERVIDPGIAASIATVRRLEGMLMHADEPAQFLRALERLAGGGSVEGTKDDGRVHAE